ncbi:Rrf2 family transcriptional regulator [Galenea microaerophila]
MKLTSRGRYAVTAMLDIAVNQCNGAITLAVISERQGISLSYLEQIFSKLKKAGLVVSARGPGGGYRLSRDASQIFINQIIHAVNEDMDPRRCKGKGNCDGGAQCASHVLWDELSQMIDGFLGTISIQHLMDQAEQKTVKLKI